MPDRKPSPSDAPDPPRRIVAMRKIRIHWDGTVEDECWPDPQPGNVTPRGVTKPGDLRDVGTRLWTRDD